MVRHAPEIHQVRQPDWKPTPEGEGYYDHFHAVDNRSLPAGLYNMVMALQLHYPETMA